MHFAKKLALVDPKVLDELQTDREYKATQRPAPAVAKRLSVSISVAYVTTKLFPTTRR